MTYKYTDDSTDDGQLAELQGKAGHAELWSRLADSQDSEGPR